MATKSVYSRFFQFRTIVFLIPVLWLLMTSYWLYDTYNYIRLVSPEIKIERILLIVLIETIILLAILRPNSYRPPNWLRVVLAFILFCAWSFFLLLSVIHSGSLYIVHLFCLIILDVSLFALLIMALGIFTFSLPNQPPKLEN